MSKKLESKSPLDATPGSGFSWPRSDPAELAKFDPRTKQCSMNCGQHRDDPRSKKEVLFQCDDCTIVKPVVPACSIECDVDIETGKGTMCPNPVTHTWFIDRKKSHLCEMHAKRLGRIGIITTATITADKNLPESTANALATMIQLASEQLARGDFHNQNHENTDTISELATNGRMGRDEPETAGAREAADHLLVTPMDSQND